VNRIYFILFQREDAREAPCTLDQPQWSRHDVASTARAGGEDDAPLSRCMGTRYIFILFQREVAREAPCMLDQPQWSRHDVASTTRAGGEDDAPLSCSMWTGFTLFYFSVGLRMRHLAGWISRSGRGTTLHRPRAREARMTLLSPAVCGQDIFYFISA
jgi:hypothetical protein